MTTKIHISTLPAYNMFPADHDFLFHGAKTICESIQMLLFFTRIFPLFMCKRWKMLCKAETYSLSVSSQIMGTTTVNGGAP